jgi:hypothetical protein
MKTMEAEALELLTSRLRRHLSAPGDPSMSKAQADQARYACLMLELSRFFRFCTASLDLSDAFTKLGIALDDLSRGTVGPLVTPTPPKGSPPTRSDTWYLRSRAAVGYRCLLLAGLSDKDAAKLAAEEAPGLQHLVRHAQPSADRKRAAPSLEKSLNGWLSRLEDADADRHQHKELRLLEALLKSKDNAERRLMGLHILRTVSERALFI